MMGWLPVGRMALLLGSAFALWLGTRELPVAPWAWAVKGVLWLLWPLVLWCSGVVSPLEKAHAVAAVRGALNRLRPVAAPEKIERASSAA